MADPSTLKILTLGDSSVGKTCLLLRYAEDDFPKNTMPTIGIEYKTKMINANNQTIKLQIWDTAGQERYHRILASTFYRRANGIVLVYDLTERSSFMNVESWMKQIRQKADPGIEIVLVGNKLDLVQGADFSEGKKMADDFGIPFFVVSAKTGEGVTEAFKTLTDMIISHNPAILKSTGQGNKLTKDPTILDRVKCCT